MKSLLARASLGFCIVSVLSGCSEAADCEGEPSCGDAFVIDQNRSYTRLFGNWDTLEECLATPDEFFFGCSELFELCANGNFRVILTDILNEGMCESAVADKPIECTVESDGDLRSGLVLTVTREPFNVAEFPDGRHPWVEDSLTESEQERLDRDCER